MSSFLSQQPNRLNANFLRRRATPAIKPLKLGALVCGALCLSAAGATPSTAAPTHSAPMRIAQTQIAPARVTSPDAAIAPLPLPAATGGVALPAGTRGTASNNTASGNTATGREFVTKDYVLGPDDRISVTSISHPEVIYQGAVSSDGKINVAQLGAIMASGKTLAQLESELMRRMDEAGFLRPIVTVTLQQPRLRQVFVLRAKGGSGSFEIRPGFRLTDVLAVSQAMGDFPATLVDATLTRRGQKNSIALDLPAVLRDPNGKANLLIQNGDTLRVVPRTVQVSFAGKIAHTGVLDVPIGSSIVEALALAGGVQTEKAALTRASLKRASGEIIPINLFDVLIKGQPEPRITFQEGDLVIVPEAQERVTVQGAIQHPGYFDIQDGKTLKLSELIALAGGPTSRAAETRTLVQHEDGTSQVINLFKVLSLLDPTNNIELNPNDIITVPDYEEHVTVAGSGAKGSAVVTIAEGTTMRVLNALSQAGGLSVEPEAISITVTRNMPGAVATLDPSLQPTAPTILTVDPIKLYKLGDPNENIPLQNGDLVMVTSTPRKVYLSGEVKSPGVIDLTGDEGLTEVLKQAGGVTDNGLLSGVIVERNGQKYTVDVFKALNDGEKVNFPLQTGDNIVVPKNMNRVLILPGVNEPGYHAIPEDRPLTIPEALSLAGGPRDADLKNVVLLRSTPEGLKREPLPLRTSEQFVKASKVVMHKGDILYIPMSEPHKPNIGQRFLGLLPFANALGGGLFPIF